MQVRRLMRPPGARMRHSCRQILKRLYRLLHAVARANNPRILPHNVLDLRNQLFNPRIYRPVL